MTDFFRTRMGATFFGVAGYPSPRLGTCNPEGGAARRTLPELVRQLTRIADLMERLIDQAEAERISTPVERKPEEEE